MKSPNDVVTAQMLKTGFVPGKGLGKDQKGITEPIFPSGQIDTKGLGYSFYRPPTFLYSMLIL